MKNTTVSQSAPRLNRIVKSIIISAAFVIGIILLPTPASMQSNDTLPTGDAKQDLQQSPQTSTRPDILWMRGGNTGRVEATIYSPDGQMIAVSSGRQIKIYRPSDGMLLQTIDYTYSGIYKPMGFSPDSKTIAVANEVLQPRSEAIQIWRISDRTMVRSIPISDPNSVGVINFSPDGTKIIAGFHIYNVSDGSIYFYTANPDIYPEFYSQDGQFIYGDSRNSSTGATAVVRWNGTNPTTPTTIDNSGNAGSPVDISPNGQFIVTNSSRVVRITDGVTVAVLGSYGHYAFSPDGNYIAGESRNGIFTIFRTTDYGVVWTSAAEPVGEPGSLSFSPDSQMLAVSTSSTRLLNASNGSLIRGLTTLRYAPVQSLAFSNDGLTLATASPDTVSQNSFGNIQLWNVADGSHRNVNFTQSIGLRLFQIFSTPDSQQLVTLDGIPDFYVKFWNANDGSLIKNVSVGSFNRIDIALSPDMQTYACDIGTASGGAVDFYNASNDTLIRRVDYVGFGNGSAYSPNSQLLAVSGGGFNTQVKLIRVSDGTVLPQTLNLAGRLSGLPSDMVFSSDNQTIAVTEATGDSNTRNGIIELFRVSDGALLRTFGTFDNWGASVAFSPDGQTVIGTGQDATVRIWRVSDGALLQTYDKETYIQPSGGSAVLWQVAYSPDGSRFAYGRQDTAVVMARNPYPTTPPTTYTISGSITRNSSALNGVTVALNGSTSGTTTTDVSGNYSFTVTDGGSYTITPTLASNTFAPASQSFNFISQNQTANFTASLVTHTISGNITRSGAALSGATVNLSGSSTGSTTTDNNGNYSLTVNEGGNYTVTPAIAGNIFTPTNQSFNNLTTNQTANFTALFSTYTISGNVKADGANLPGATVSLTGTQTQMTTTDANGNYTFTANTNGNYTVTPYKNGYVFTPDNQTFTNLQANQTANFQNGAPLCAPAPSSLTAWYQGNGNALDSSGNNNSGAINNGATFGAGKSGQAFSLDGFDDFVLIPDSPNNSPTSAMTIDVWAKPTQIKQQVFISKYAGSVNEARSFYLDTDATGTKVRFAVYQSPATNTVLRSVQTTNNALTLNVFTHITATFDTATQAMHIYVNGADAATTTLNSDTVTIINDSTTNIRIGALRDGAGNDVEIFNGLLDEVQIYNRALSVAEVQNIYNAGSASVCLISSFTGGGMLDTTFNGTGKVTTPIGGSDDIGYSTAIQADGRIVVAGSVNNGSNQDFGLVRYNTDGTLDTTFGTGGKVTTAIGGSDDVAYSMAIQTDGKIVAAGITHNSNDDVAVVRYNTDGTLDTTFGTNGKVVTTIGGSDDEGYTMTIQPDGKILVGGATYSSGNTHIFALLRYNTNGTLDQTFGPGGAVTTSVIGSHDDISTLSIQTDGKIIAAGSADAGGQYDWAIVRYNPNGSLDTTFNGSGKKTTSFGGNESVESVLIQADGRIVAAGYATLSANFNSNYALARYNSDGTLDTTFGTNGTTSAEFGVMVSAKFQADGKIIMGGYSNNGSNRDFALARFTPNGTLDTSFGTFGKVLTPIGNADDIGRSIVLQTDGKIVLAGSSNISNSDFAVVRYNADGSIASQGSTTTHTRSKITFTSTRVAGRYQIFTMDSDGSNPVNLTNTSSDEVESNWSPDGSKIVFASSRNNNYEIYTMNADGSNQTRLTDNTTTDSMPDWSPDGSKIVFRSNRDGSTSEIYSMNADGSNQTRLTSNTTNDYFPTWSPNGTKVAYINCFNSSFDSCELYTMNADGTSQTRLTNDSNSDGYPDWSPDGTKIIMHRDIVTNGGGFGNSEIVSINPDGSGLTNLTNIAGNDYFGTWTPDATKIVFTSSRSGNDEIYSMNADGTNQTRLTYDPQTDFHPAWQPVVNNAVVSPASNVVLTFSNSAQSGYTIATPLTASQLPALPSGYTLPANAPMYDIRTSAGYSGNITVSFNVPNITNSATCASLRSLHYENGAWTTATNGTPSYNSAAQNCTVSQTVTSLSPFVVVQSLAPTAATVSIGGNVVTPQDLGLTKAIVTLTDSRGKLRTTLTGKLGSFRFNDVAAGETYIISVASKRYTYAPQIVTPTENLTGIVFTPQ